MVKKKPPRIKCQKKRKKLIGTNMSITDLVDIILEDAELKKIF